jgi:Tfp pilus assembly protein FimT
MKSRAFTFIELVLVATIILVLIGFVVPIFRKSFYNIKLRNTCQNIVQLMRYAQVQAIAERKFCKINFDFEKGTYQLTVADNNFPDEFKNIAGKWGNMFTVPESVSISGENPFIIFYPDGNLDKVKITISDNETKTFTINAQRSIRCVQTEE